MNRGSVAVPVARGRADRASMRPRFMNRGSGRGAVGPGHPTRELQ